MKQALVLGATGLTGGHLLELLLEDDNYGAVTVISRSPLRNGTASPKLKQIIVEHLFQMREHAEAFAAEDVFCCLGTTIRKAGSRDQFRTVDYSYVLEAGRLAKEAGAARFLLVSSIGANKQSPFFYTRVKGETEQALQQLGLPSLYIFRPSMLLGVRAEFRFGERLATIVQKPFRFLYRGALGRYRPIHARDVAKVMRRAGQFYMPGVHLFENEQLHAMSRRD